MNHPLSLHLHLTPTPLFALRTGRALTARHILAAILSLHFSLFSLHFSLFTLHFSLFTLPSSAATLSLTSTNDYRFLQFTTNETYDIRGLGTGPEGLYSMPRREDILFLYETMAERDRIANALISSAAVVTTGAYWTVTNENYASMPQYMDNSLFDPWFRGNLFGTNVYDHVVARMVPFASANFITQPFVTNLYVTSQNDFGGPFAHMFVDGRYPTSRTLNERMWNYEDVEFGNLFPAWILAFGYITNAYVDVIANSDPLYCQSTRCGSNGWTRTEHTYNSEAQTYSYDYDGEEWIRSTSPDNTTTNTGGSAYSTRSLLYRESASGYKWSKVAYERDGSEASKIRYDSYTLQDLYYDFNPQITFPKIETGATLNGVRNAFAIVSYMHTIQSGTNYFLRTRKAFVIPTALVYAGTTPAGYPLYRERSISSAEIYYTACKRLANDDMKTSSELLGMIDYPDYPSASVTRRTERTNYKYISEIIVMEVLAYVGAANVTFNARVIE